MFSDAVIEFREDRNVENQAEKRALRILLAEDDSLLREVTSSRLRENGYLVVEAQTGEQALSMLSTGERGDLLITDISMPGSVDGWALAEQARLMHPQVLVIYTSSRSRDVARQVHCSLYICKPYHPDGLIAAIQQLIGDTSRKSGQDS